MKKILAISSLVALSGMMGGCATSQNQNKIPEADFKFSPEAMEELSKTSVESRDALRILAKIRDSVAQKGMTKEDRKNSFEQAVNVPKGFDKVATISYTGDLVGAVKLLAISSGYPKVEEIGKRPRSKIIVSIEQRNVPLVNALRETGMQAGNKADIEVYPTGNLIRIKYKDTDQLSSSVYNK